MRTQYRNYYFFFFFFFFFLGGGGGGHLLIADVVKKLAVNRRTKFRNTHWSDKGLTIAEDKSWK